MTGGAQRGRPRRRPHPYAPRQERFFRSRWPNVIVIVLMTIKGLISEGPWFIAGLYAVIGIVLGVVYLFWRRKRVGVGSRG